MGYSTRYLNEEGFAACVDCRRKKFINDLAECAVCGRWVCKSCASYRRQGNPFGYVCKRCKVKLKG